MSTFAVYQEKLTFSKKKTTNQHIFNSNDFI